MMRSLWAGVSGLTNHQTRMDVLGNNIANVNTNGFKKGRVTFQDMLSQTLAGAAKPTDEVGGVNPQQVGLGMQVSTIDTIHTQGALQSTGVMTDVALQGNGFFILNAGDKRYYTRNGAFGLDQDGRLVNPADGQRVQGWMAQTVGGQTFVNNAADIQDLVIPVGSKDPAQGDDRRLVCEQPGQADTRDSGERHGPDHPGRHLADDVRHLRFVRQVPQAPGELHQGARRGQPLAGRGAGGSGRAGRDEPARADRQRRSDGEHVPAGFRQFRRPGGRADAAGNVINAGALQAAVSYDVPDATLPAGGGDGAADVQPQPRERRRLP